ncbi:hypothetical protein BISA_0860 [Bifidobacterium saguini DSM 23967]|uniref:Uncharacterized protein n=2 Tax=Bifidobacterium saguini TaxID=762210 RepID=A0A087DAA9_9BIFI|nr:hypothetical protein [Bifidobacterium saguini]KFI92459.1 hypothetical protein BISA_0860 [Bifidobacterium saguini DSM 23967]
MSETEAWSRLYTLFCRSLASARRSTGTTLNCSNRSRRRKPMARKPNDTHSTRITSSDRKRHGQPIGGYQPKPPDPQLVEIMLQLAREDREKEEKR